MTMTEKTLQKSLMIRQKGGLLREDDRVLVPSSNGERTYTVIAHTCSCPAIGLCSHLWAVTYLDGLLAIQLLRYALDDDFLMAVAEAYGPRVEILPAKVREVVRSEFVQARERLKPAMAA